LFLRLLCGGRDEGGQILFDLIKNPAIFAGFFILFAKQKTCRGNKLYTFAILKGHNLRHFAGLRQPRSTETLQACNNCLNSDNLFRRLATRRADGARYLLTLAEA
jgi:hypothetical protein